jgi:spermidine/putrescine transport system substrate-binding protein
VKRGKTSEFEQRFEHMFDEVMTRRLLLRRSATSALSVSALAYLAGCGGGSSNVKKRPGQIPKGKISKTVEFSNWPLYIDVDEKTKQHPTLEKFRQRYGTGVRYVEEINDNAEFFDRVRQLYEQRRSGGRDLQVVSDWMCHRMKELGFVQKLDKSEMPNVVNNIEDAVASPDFDPRREFSVPWQSGQVLLITRKSKVGGALASVNDLFDPKLKGKVTMLLDLRDSVGSLLLADGVKPETASKDQVMVAIERLAKGRKDGQIRRFTGNDYTDDLLKGESSAVLGWSGDAVQLQGQSKDIGYTQPEAGFMVFTDSMQVPAGAPHAFTAQKLMDFVYEPEIQATITEYVNYVPPVKGTREVLIQRNPEIAQSKLIFPDLSKSHTLRTFSPQEEGQIEIAFRKAIGR